MNDTEPFKGFESLSELGEFGLIDQIARLFDRGQSGDTIGIGDDCAVLPFREGRSLLITTDMLIEGRHFRHEWTTAEDLGFKSLAVNLSDISAMGGKPLYAFLSIGLPNDLSLEWVETFLRGTRQLSEAHNVKLLGGDTTKSPGPLVINYSVIGVMDEQSVLWRSSAEPGDKIAVLGNLGESGAGLRLLMENKTPYDSMEQRLIKSHNHPQLYVDEAQYLASIPAVHAMIDLSDGIQSDAGHIAQKSGVTVQVDVDRIPITPEVKEICKNYSWDSLELALASGEDYGLLFTYNKETAGKLKSDFKNRFGYEFSIIGEVIKGSPELNLVKNGDLYDLGKMGFDHFKNE